MPSTHDTDSNTFSTYWSGAIILHLTFITTTPAPHICHNHLCQGQFKGSGTQIYHYFYCNLCTRFYVFHHFFCYYWVNFLLSTCPLERCANIFRVSLLWWLSSFRIRLLHNSLGNARGPRKRVSGRPHDSPNEWAHQLFNARRKGQ
jgi:hypothetical protein